MTHIVFALLWHGLAHIGIFGPCSKLIKAHFRLSKHNRSQLPPAQRTTTTNSLSPFNQLTQLVHPINQSSPFNQITKSSTQSIYCNKLVWSHSSPPGLAHWLWLGHPNGEFFVLLMSLGRGERLAKEMSNFTQLQDVSRECPNVLIMKSQCLADHWTTKSTWNSAFQLQWSI